LGERKPRSLRSRILLVVINAVSIASLIWTLRDARLAELGNDLTQMNWWWVGLAMAVDVCVYLWHGWRWQTLLKPVLQLSYWGTVRSIYVGLFANEILPFRVGEVLRCYLLARNPQLPLSVSLTSALIERIFDGIWLTLCIVLMLRMTPFPHDLRYLVDGGYALGGAVMVVGIFIAIAMFLPHKTHEALRGTRWQKQFQVFMDDLELMGHSRSLITSFFLSLPYLLLMIIPIFASMRGYGFDLSWGVAFVLMVVLRLGTIVPQAPGNLGLFQVLVKVSLEKIFNVVPEEAARFSLILWAVVTLPLLVGGAISLAVTESKLSELHEEARGETSNRF
jgi:glycosyltransferase 2 family protein